MHKFRYRFSLIISILLMLIVTISAQAQSGNQSLIAFRNGDLWKYNLANNTASQLTQWGYNGGPILSPDGRRIAYLSTASLTLDNINNGSAGYAGDAPANIWVMDTASEQFQRIVDQTGGGTLGIIRSVPSWSPDSSKLVWSELNLQSQGADTTAIKYYDFNTAQLRTLVNGFNMGFQDGGYYMASIKWGGAGISHLLFTYVEGSRDPQQYMEIYDPNTGNLTTYNLGFNSQAGNAVNDYLWVNHQGRSMIALSLQGRWELFDPTNGSRTAMSAAPHLRLKFGTGIELIPVQVTNEIGSYVTQWQAQFNGQIYNFGYISYSISDFTPAISADGRTVAWHSSTGVSTWQIGAQATGRADEVYSSIQPLVPRPSSVVWAATEWVTSDTIVQPLPTATYIPGGTVCNLGARLQVGQNAVVLPGPKNNVRTAAAINATVINQISPGEVLYVEQGPICANGYNWYRVRNNRIVGWTAEGGEGVYWLSVDTSSSYCWNSPPARLNPQGNGIVLPGEPNNLRSQPGVGGTSEVLAVIPAGASFLVTNVPTCGTDGRRWYPIRYNNINGWTAEGEGSEYWVAPV